MKYAIKRTDLNFNETFLDTKFDSREAAAESAKMLNRIRHEHYSVVEVEEVKEVKRYTKVTRNGKTELIGDIKAFPGAPYYKTTISMEFAKANCSEELEAIYIAQGYTISHFEVSRATF